QKAQGQPWASTIRGTAWMVAMLRRKPSEVWSVSAVPTESPGAASVTIAENWAESDTTKKPQTSTIGIRRKTLPEKKKPTTSAQAPLAAIDRFTTKARPRRSASHPPQIDPRAPAAMAPKAMTSTALEPSERAEEAARKAGIQVHMA